MGIRPVPAQYQQTQGFYQDLTQYNLGKGHGAIDFGTPVGVEVVAIADGTVVLAGNSAHFPGAPDAYATDADYRARLYFLKGSGGNIIATDHGGYLSTNSHLSKVFVKPGQRVKAGQVIGLTGYSGIVVPAGPGGAHLHFEIIAKPYAWGNGYFGRVDPAPYITEPYRKTSIVTTQGAVVAKAYKHETKWTTPWTQPRSFYGFPSKPTAVTIHHWGNDGQHFDAVCHFLCDRNRDPRTATSAHTVLEDGRIATLAVPEVATFHSGSTPGNGSSIGIECRPEMTKGDVDTLVQYLYELETVYGSLNVYFHEEWFATACPGRYKAIRDDVITRVNAMHSNRGRDPKLTGAPAPKPVVKKPAPAKPKKKTAREENPTGWNVWRYRNADIETRDAYAILRGISADIDDIKKKIGA